MYNPVKLISLSPILLLAFPYLAASQSVGQLPACAQSCIGGSSALPASCSTTNIACICADKSFIAAISCCIAAKCPPDQIPPAVAFAEQLCSSVDVTIPTTIPATCLATSRTLQSSAATMPATMATTVASMMSGSASSEAGPVSSSLSLTVVTTAITATTTSAASAPVSASTTGPGSAAAATPSSGIGSRLQIQREGLGSGIEVLILLAMIAVGGLVEI